MNRRKLPVAVVCAAMTIPSFGASSATSLVYTRSDSSILWRTVTSSHDRLALNWPEGAVRAELVVTRGKKSEVVQIADTTLTSVPFPVAVPETPEDECVVKLTLSYLDKQSVVLSREEAEVGVVTGCENGVAVKCLPRGEADRKWGRVRGHAVVPVPADATAMILDGKTVECSMPGWYFLEDMYEGEHLATLMTESAVYNAALYGVPGGLMLFIR